ncbi:class I SAM-dependent methyltransferase [Bradyrhizobium sp. 157]|jgi:SAM-dependent methyltransferase|uniref:class I SAM-dependent methyltransferase n=1 Tax=Bradyrhizobium sp. 157 TaxID=2782631 RepID=UPI001FFA0AF9|nr:class I SAM-dependent methyltransferase [Bradyrhizobium sp. 157]MCK1640733.1 class I SAM-dependent methyltransferase [Bradyrhizobium sp. 157]
MTQSATSLNQRQVIHREVWARKKALRALYHDFHRQLFENCPAGTVLDIGGGTAHIKESRPDVVSADILSFPGIDVVADAHRLPFRNEIFDGVVMLDVLHHLERPIEFLKEASRVLKPGGCLAMIEPAMTTIARRFYDRFHEEPVDMNADPFALVAIDPDRDPFDANQAIPTLLFATAPACRRIEQTVPSLRIRTVEWHSLFAYPMSGGFQKWSLIPGSLVGPMLAFERKVPAPVRKHLAFRMMIVLQRI